MLEENLEDPQILAMCGTIYQSLERYGMAYHLYRRAIELGPPISGAYNNTALALIEIPGREDEAETYLRKALKLDPDNADAMSNMAVLSMRMSRPNDAVFWANKALKHPNATESGLRAAKENLGYASLALGDFQNGWDGYEAMVGQKWRPLLPNRDEPYWNGEKGKRLYVTGEQGIGDEISFASILPDAMKDNTIAYDCDERLEGLFKRSFPSLEIHGTRFAKKRPGWRKSRDFDAHCLIGSLAWHYRPTAESFPGKPFLVADPDRVAQWKTLTECLPGRKIGLAWTGGLPTTFKSRRSVTLESLLPILKTPGCSFVSLQYQDPTDEIEALYANHGIRVHHWKRASEAQDIDEVAALIASLDMVIAVTTAAVDIAGGLGVPCWVLVPSKPHWRYGMKGETKVWYESVRIFRQVKEWKDVIQKVAGELAERFYWG